ncbi:MAG: hypothetical protein AAGK97_05255 [Bacteroidota bacterium]
MKRSFNIFTLVAIALCMFSCKTEKKEDLKPLDLLEYGFPLTIMAPDSADVKKMDLTFQQDLTVKKGDDYYVQIFSANASTLDSKVLKEQKLLEVQSNPYFSKIVQEDDNGFIYEKAVDTSRYNYDFIFVRVQGDKEYVYQTGLIGNFDLEDVQRMYKAVQ